MMQAQQWLDQGIAERERAAFDAALACFDHALQLQPDWARAHSCRGAVLQDLGQVEAALACFNTALQYRPDYPQALANAGNALCQLGRFREAVSRYDAALQHQPDTAQVWFNRGNALLALGQLGAALHSLDQAIALAPDFAEAHSNRGMALLDGGQTEAAIAAYLQALQYQPNLAQAQWNLGLAYLQQGDFRRGWPLYEWRWQTPAYQADRPLPQFPEWDGESVLTDRSVLLISEQGLGDTLQFCRYASVLAQSGARVTLQAPTSLVALLRSLPGITVVGHGSALPAPFDFQCPLLSVPGRLGTTAETIPGQLPYLRSEPGRRALWQSRLDAWPTRTDNESPNARRRQRIGLVWRGNPAHPHDSQRSIPLAELLRALPDHCDYVSLQLPADLPPAERALLAEHGIAEPGSEFRDWSDTAALCDLLDAVVGVDTSVVHLVGALGRPGYLLLAAVPEWRWQRDRADSPWYPTLQLLRQSQPGDWKAPLQALNSLLDRSAK